MMCRLPNSTEPTPADRAGSAAQNSLHSWPPGSTTSHDEEFKGEEDPYKEALPLSATHIPGRSPAPVAR